MDIGITQYDRLNEIAKDHFGSLYKLAKLLEMKDHQYFYAYKGREFGDRILKDLEENLRINPEYIKYGTEPVFLDEKAVSKGPVKIDFNDLPKIEDLTINQIKMIKAWYDTNFPAMEKLLDTYNNLAKE